MRLVGSGQQQRRDFLYSADGTITSGGTAQLVLAQSQSRSFLLLQNLSAGPLYVEIGAARATCTISNGAVASVSVANAGFNYTKPPVVRFLGGGGNVPFLG